VWWVGVVCFGGSGGGGGGGEGGLTPLTPPQYAIVTRDIKHWPLELLLKFCS